MGYVWSGFTARGTPITNEIIQEMRGHGDSRAVNIVTMSPAPSACAAYNKWLQPLGGDSVSINSLFDELQLNLNYLRTNNWCRGYEVTCTTNYTAKHGTIYTAYNTPAHSGKNTSVGG